MVLSAVEAWILHFCEQLTQRVGVSMPQEGEFALLVHHQIFLDVME